MVASKILVILIEQNKSWVFPGWKTLLFNEYKWHFMVFYSFIYVGQDK